MDDARSSDLGTLRVTREESRRVLDHQITWQTDLDDKALRTVRLSLVLVALVVSVVRFLESSDVGTFETGSVLSIAAGTILLGFAVFVGLGVYAETVIPFGIGRSHRSEVMREPYSEREWLQVLLDEYDMWTETANEANELNALWLGRAQIAMTFAIGYLFVSITTVISSVPASDAFFGISLLGGIALLLWYVLVRPREDE